MTQFYPKNLKMIKKNAGEIHDPYIKSNKGRLVFDPKFYNAFLTEKLYDKDRLLKRVRNLAKYEKTNDMEG